MFRMSSNMWCRLAIIAAISVSVAALAVNQASADPPGFQLEWFYWNDGTPVEVDRGMPFADAGIYRWYDRREATGIEWGVMTQQLVPATTYDIWLEGSNDGTEEGEFVWWLGSAKTSALGEVNTFGHVFVGDPPGPYVGSFENPRAALYLVIRTTDGTRVQTAFFQEW